MQTPTTPQPRTKAVQSISTYLVTHMPLNFERCSGSTPSNAAGSCDNLKLHRANHFHELLHEGYSSNALRAKKWYWFCSLASVTGFSLSNHPFKSYPTYAYIYIIQLDWISRRCEERDGASTKLT